jgi:RHS repeat-associated protein
MRVAPVVVLQGLVLIASCSGSPGEPSEEPSTLDAGETAVDGGAAPDVEGIDGDVPDAGNATDATFTDATFDAGDDAGPDAADGGPAPSLQGPPIDPHALGGFAAAVRFLYTGASPVQTGVAADAIDPRRATVLRGQVTTRGSGPIANVTVRVIGHPEFGSTLTRADGMFDMVVNGGGWLTVEFTLAEHLAAQRQVVTPWHDYVRVPDVALVPLDPIVTAITLDGAAAQLAKSSAMTDADGTRQAAMLFAPGTTATMTVGGVVQPLTTLSVRATEYTVGSDGPKAMPGPLPPTSAYTYAVELSADEALAQGATEVTFSKPVVTYVDNFLGFAVGTHVPAGYYDRQRGVWVPSDDGRVIAIVAINGGVADVDADGDQIADDAAALAALGITLEEQQTLGTTYAVGTKLWRVPVDHFTPWDYNFGDGLPPDAVAPDVDADENDEDDDPCEQPGSTIECENQTLGEAIALPGTPYRLHYRSNRMPGRKSHLEIPLSHAAMPASVTGIRLELDIAGQHISKAFAATPDQSFQFAWDGTDGYGRTVFGPTPLTIRLGYTYKAVAYRDVGLAARSFAQVGYGNITSVVPRAELAVWSEQRLTLRAPVQTADWAKHDLGGWSLEPQHALFGSTLFRGDGRKRHADALTALGISRAGGTYYRCTFALSLCGNETLATASALYDPEGVAVAPDGTVYVTERARNMVRSISPDGIIHVFAGTGTAGFSGDGGSATSAKLSQPYDVAVGRDGSVYISDQGNHRIRKVTPDGNIDTFAGNGNSGSSSGDDGPATQATIGALRLVEGPDGSIVFTEAARVRKISPDGIITTIAGGGPGIDGGDGGPALQASFYCLEGLDFGHNGELYVVDRCMNRVRRIGIDGIITKFAGTGTAGFSGDGGPAADADMRPIDVAVAPDGRLYIADYYNNRVRRVGADGIVTTIAGDGRAASPGYGDDGPAMLAQIGSPLALAFAPDEALYIAQIGVGDVIRRVAGPALRARQTELLVASEDGDQVFVFDAGGKHLRTTDALTGATVHQFGYDAAGRLTSITDDQGNVTSIVRDGLGVPTTIVAPGNQATTLALDANGFLARVTAPGGAVTTLTNDPGGLLTSVITPGGAQHKFTYDSLGRLVQDEDPSGAATVLVHSLVPSGRSVSLTKGGLTRTITIERGSSNEVRRTLANESGAARLVSSAPSSVRTASYADGSSALVQSGADPRWKLQAPFVNKVVLSTPSGKKFQSVLTRTATLSDTNDPSTLTQEVKAATVNGRTYKQTYDAAAGQFTYLSPTGYQSQRLVNAAGKVVEDRPASGLTPITFAYDAAGKLLQAARGAQSTTIAYDASGRATSYSDALGNKADLGYDAAAHLTSLKMPGGGLFSVTVDAAGNRTSLTMPSGAMHTFGYDARALVTSFTPAGGTAYTFSYDANRDLTQLALPDGRAVNLTHDAGGRIASISYAEATVNASYVGATSRVETLTRVPSTGTTQSLAFTYDGGLVTGRIFGGVATGSYALTYDDNLSITSVALDGGPASARSYDGEGHLASNGPLTFERTGPVGRVSAISGGGAPIVAVSYDTFGRESARSLAVGGSTQYERAVTFDAAGRLATKTEIIEGVSHLFEYAYDADGQLLEVRRDATPREIYAYDANGNRTSRQIAGDAAETATYDTQDRVAQRGAAIYQWNDAGQMSQRGADAFVYSARGELLSATVGGAVVTYDYDALGRRVARTSDGGAVTEQYLYAENGYAVTHTKDPVNGTSAYFYDDRGQLVAVERGGARYFVATDQVGTPLVVTDASGAIVMQLEYDAFGNLASGDPSAFALPVGFAGGMPDPLTGLVRFGSRDYDAEVGRFTARDPAFFGGGQFNLYTYALNDPLFHIDPTGFAAAPAGDRGRASGDTKGAIRAYLCKSGGRPGDTAAQRAFDQVRSDRDNLPGMGGDPTLSNLDRYFFAADFVGTAPPGVNVALAVGVSVASVGDFLSKTFTGEGRSKPSIDQVYWGVKGAIDGLRGTVTDADCDCDE